MQISDLTLAATVAGYSSAAGAQGVLPDAQVQLDHAANTVAALGGELQRSNGILAQLQGALRAEQNTARELVLFENFVQKRESDLRGKEGQMLTEIQNLNQKVFMLEHSPEDPGSAATNAAPARCHATENANLVLRAQLAAATTLVEQCRAAAPTPGLNPAAPHGSAADIRHPTLHRTLLPALGPQGAAQGDELKSAQSMEEWYGNGPGPAAAPGPCPQSLNPCPQYSMCGSGIATSYAGPPGATPGPARLVFNAFQSVTGACAPLPSEDPARFRQAGATANELRAPGPGGPAEFARCCLSVSPRPCLTLRRRRLV